MIAPTTYENTFFMKIAPCQALISNVRRVAVELAGTAAELSEGRRGEAKEERRRFEGK